MAGNKIEITFLAAAISFLYSLSFGGLLCLFSLLIQVYFSVSLKSLSRKTILIQSNILHKKGIMPTNIIKNQAKEPYENSQEYLYSLVCWVYTKKNITYFEKFIFKNFKTCWIIFVYKYCFYQYLFLDDIFADRVASQSHYGSFCLQLLQLHQRKSIFDFEFRFLSEEFKQFQLETIQNNWEELAKNASSLTEIQAGATLGHCEQFVFDQSEFWDTAVTENSWVCSKVTTEFSMGMKSFTVNHTRMRTSHMP